MGFAMTIFNINLEQNTNGAYAKGMSNKGANQGKSSADALAKQLQETRERLEQTIEDIGDYVRPKNIATRSMDKVTDFFKTDDGQPQTQRIAAALASVVGTIGLLKKSRGKKDS